MIDQRDVERAAARFRLPDGSFERLELRRDRKRRDRRVRAGVVGLLIAIAVGWWGFNEIYNAPVPADNDRSSQLGIFEPVAGRIVYGNKFGIWGVDPTRPADPSATVQLTSDDATPLGWSKDGTRLLIEQDGSCTSCMPTGRRRR